MVVAIQTVPLRLYKWVIECICSRSHICLKRSVSWLGHQPYNSAGIASAPGDLLLESPEIAFTTLASVGGFSRAALIGTLGRRAMASLLMLDGRLRMTSKCSAQRPRILSWSVMIRERLPALISALRSGDEDRGPYTDLRAL